MSKSESYQNQQTKSNLEKVIKEVYDEPKDNFYDGQETRDNFESSAAEMQSYRTKDEPVSIGVYNNEMDDHDRRDELLVEAEIARINNNIDMTQETA